MKPLGIVFDCSLVWMFSRLSICTRIDFRSERDDFSKDMSKHRKFDNPHAVQGGKRGKHDRGWATGTVGWGVQVGE